MTQSNYKYFEREKFNIGSGNYPYAKGENIRLRLGPEHVIVRGIRPEEGLWGPYQFPGPHSLPDGRIAVVVHTTDDDIRKYGAPGRWFVSSDKGASWKEASPDIEDEIGLVLPGGERFRIPTESAFSVKDYYFTPFEYRTPAVDMDAASPEGILPVPDGVLSWMHGTDIFAYDARRLPPSLAGCRWKTRRRPASAERSHEEYADVEWPWLTRVVHIYRGSEPVMKAISPRGTLKLGPDGALWVTAFSGEGHLDPSTGLYSPYYSAELFRSEDGGRHFYQHAHMEYPADGKEYPYASGGFSDSDIAWMKDGSMVWFFRSNWYATTGEEWSPMYWTRSEDGGRTWEKPRIFSPLGTLPRLVTLECGRTLLCYARPGMFVTATLDDSGRTWMEPLMCETTGDRSHLANIVQTPPKFHDYDGACNNPVMIPIGPDRVLIFYADFYVPDSEGVKRKTIMCREVIVEVF